MATVRSHYDTDRPDLVVFVPIEAVDLIVLSAPDDDERSRTIIAASCRGIVLDSLSLQLAWPDIDAGVSFPIEFHSSIRESAIGYSSSDRR